MTQTSSTSKLVRFYPQALLCSLLVLVAILLSHPAAEVGINDDWSYIRSAQLMARTGHFMYVGWASAMLGWMLPLGALFIKVFGFSFTVVRASVALIAVLNAFLLQRCMVRSGLTEPNAALATLTLVFSPIYLPLATTFMTDVPGMFVTLLCYYACLRALQAPADRSASGWLALAMLCSSLGGTARQTAWLGVLFLAPSAAWLLRKRRLPWALLGIVWILSISFIYASLSWFKHQPYALGEALVAGYIDRDLVFGFVSHVMRAFLALCLLLSPLLISFLPGVDLHSFRVRRWLATACGLVVLSTAILLWRHHLLAWLAPFDGNYFTEKGVVDIKEVGIRRDMLGPLSRGLLSLLTLAGAMGAVAFFLKPHPLPSPTLARGEGAADPAAGLPPTLQQLLVLLGPFSAAYFLLTCHRALFAFFFDRYLIVLLFPAVLLLTRIYQDRFARRLPMATVVLLVVFGFFSTAATHDLFSMERARVQAAQTLMSAGLDRNDFIGGWEWDGWTQVDRYGFMNNGYMYTPQGFTAAPQIQRKIVHRPCGYGWVRFCPHLEPKYALSFDEVSCDGPSHFAPVPYSSWLPPHGAKIYIQRVDLPVYGP